MDSVKKKVENIFKWCIYYPALALVCFEIALLILGYRRYKIEPYTVKAIPENAYVGDSIYGIALNPGTYAVTLNDSIRFTANHTSEKRRHTPRTDSESVTNRIALLGCSFTYGYGVNDTETFAANLQNKHANWQISNQGVIGYGTVQSYLQIQEIISNQTADAIVLNFSSFHFMRNVLSQAYRKNLKLGYAQSASQIDSLMVSARFPYITDCSAAINYADWNTMHENWAGREWSALINWIQTFYESRQDIQNNELELTACLIDKIYRSCQKANIQFGVVCLDTTTQTNELKASLAHIPWLDVGFDFEDPRTTHLPFDSHPNALGHEQIALKIDDFLIQLLRHVE